jgi:hypothetical protein
VGTLKRLQTIRLLDTVAVGMTNMLASNRFDGCLCGLGAARLRFGKEQAREKYLTAPHP